MEKFNARGNRLQVLINGRSIADFQLPGAEA